MLAAGGIDSAAAMTPFEILTCSLSIVIAVVEMLRGKAAAAGRTVGVGGAGTENTMSLAAIEEEEDGGSVGCAVMKELV